MHNATRRLSSVLAFTLLVSTVPTGARAGEPLPSGYEPVAGESSYSKDGKTGTLVAKDPATIGQWNQGFNIAAGHTFNALLPSNGAHLSRDITANPSEIFGAFNVPQGKFFLVNKNGVYFAPGASVNAAGLVASSLDMQNQDFLNGNYKFFQNGSNPAAVVNEANMQIGRGGLALLGGSVKNTGTITAKESSVALASGEKMTLAFDPQGMLSVLVDESVKSKVVDRNGAEMKDAVSNTGIVRAEGGKVTMTAEAAGDLFDKLVNNSGIVEAQSLGSRNGVVELVSRRSPGVVSHTGSIDASGREAGETGGRVTVYGDVARVSGSIRATGAAGGGFAETSGVSGLSVTRAPELGAGGHWLLDPRNVVISNSTSGAAPSPGGWSPFADDATVSAASIESALNAGTSVTIDTNNSSGTQAGDITVASPIVKSNPNFYSELILTAANDVVVSAPIGVSNGAVMSVRLRGDDDASGAGGVFLNAAVNPGNGGLESVLELRGVRVDVGVALDGPFTLDAQGDALRFQRPLGAASPLFATQVFGGTIDLGPVTTLNAQRYVNLPRYGELYTSGFETTLRGNLTTTLGGGVTLEGATRLAAPVAIRSFAGNGAPEGAEGRIALGYSVAFTPARLTGPHALTLSTDGAIEFYSYERPGSAYEIGLSGDPLGSLTITEARYADLEFVRAHAGSIRATGTSLHLNGHFETAGGPLSLVATDLHAHGLFRTNGGALSLRAAQIRMGGDFDTAGGALQVSGPAVLETAFPNGFTEVPSHIRTQGGRIFFEGPVRLAADSTISTPGGSLTFNSTVTGTNWAAEDLTLEAGSGSLVMNGAVGYNPLTGSGLRLGRVRVLSARDATFGAPVGVSSFYQAGGSGVTTFRSLLDTYHSMGVDLNGNLFAFHAPVRTQSGGTVTISNLGTLTTAAAADFSLDGAFVQDGAGASRLAGDLRTTGDPISFRSPVTLTGDVFMGTGTGSGNITFGSTLNGVTSGQEDLTLQAGTGDVTFGGQVGYNPATGTGVRIGRFVVQSARNLVAQSIFTAASIVQQEGTGTSTFRGILRTNQSPGISLTGNNFVLNGAIATVGQILVRYRGTVTRSGSYSPQPTLQKRA